MCKYWQPRGYTEDQLSGCPHWTCPQLGKVSVPTRAETLKEIYSRAEEKALGQERALAGAPRSPRTEPKDSKSAAVATPRNWKCQKRTKARGQEGDNLQRLAAAVGGQGCRHSGARAGSLRSAMTLLQKKNVAVELVPALEEAAAKGGGGGRIPAWHSCHQPAEPHSILHG